MTQVNNTAFRVNSIGQQRRISAIRHCSLATLAVLASTPATSYAELHFRPFVSAQGEYQSNVFYLPDNVFAITPTNDRARNDTVRRYMVGLDADYQWSQQKFFVSAEGRRFNFDRFTELDHDEHLIYGGFDGKLGSAFDGGIHYRDEKRMASFAERDTTALTLETERIGDARLNAAITPTWQVEFLGKVRRFDSPLPTIPNFGIDENSGSIQPKYVSDGKLQAGLLFEYLEGKFLGLPQEIKYHQHSYFLTADYELTDISKLKGEIGYTQREDDNNSFSKVSAITGTLGYDRKLTGKTGFNVELFRRVDSFIAGANAVIETGGDAGVDWHPTEKIALNLSYQVTRDQFDDSTLGGTTAAREDNFQTGSLTLTYRPRDWLQFKPYTQYQRRNSNVALKSYQGFFVGLELRLQFGWPR